MFMRLRFLNNRRFYGAIACMVILLNMGIVGCAPKAPKVYRVGILSGLNHLTVIADGFKAKMTELGYIEGKNVVYDVQKTNYDRAAYQRILRKFINDKVDLIFVFPTEATIEAKSETKGTNIPVIFSFALIEDMDLVKSVREPGGNLTGVRYPGPDIALKRFEVMMEILPQAKRILIPYQRAYPIVESQLAILRPVAKAAGVTLIETPASSAPELESILNALVKPDDPGMDAILVLAEPLSITADASLVMGKFSYKYKVPVGGAAFSIDGYGSLFGITTDFILTGKLAAPLADKVLKGTPPGVIPIVSDESFMQINYKVAQDLSITIPEGVIKQANEVIR